MKYTTTLQYKRRFNPNRDTYISAQWEDSLYPEYQVEGYDGPVLKDGRHHLVPVEFNFDLQRHDNILDITFSNTTEGRKLYHLSIDASIFSDADAYTLWYIKDDILDRNLEVLKGEHFDYSDPEIVKDQRHVVTKNQLVNAFGQTVIDKSPQLLGLNSVISFMSLKKNPTIDDIIVILVRPRTSADENPDLVTPEMVNNNIKHTDGDNWADHTTTFSGNVEEYQVNPLTEGIKSLIPEITISSDTVDGDIITVNFNTDPDVEFVYLEPSVGALPKVKIPVDAEGNGSFKILTTGLDSGDEVRVKLGFKFWTSKVVYTKTI